MTSYRLTEGSLRSLGIFMLIGHSRRLLRLAERLLLSVTPRRSHSHRNRKCPFNHYLHPRFDPGQDAKSQKIKLAFFEFFGSYTTALDDLFSGHTVQKKRQKNSRIIITTYIQNRQPQQDKVERSSFCNKTNRRKRKLTN
jgi:hypothetical protein